MNVQSHLKKDWGVPWQQVDRIYPPEDLVALMQRAEELRLKQVQRQQPEVRISPEAGIAALNHATPLAPLRERDVQALSDWFDREDIHHVETDVIRNLLLRWPEPCWEDDPLEFLGDYLKS